MTLIMSVRGTYLWSVVTTSRRSKGHVLFRGSDTPTTMPPLPHDAGWLFPSLFPTDVLKWGSDLMGMEKQCLVREVLYGQY